MDIDEIRKNVIDIILAKDLSSNKENIICSMENIDFDRKLQAMIEKNNYSCKEVFLLSRYMLNVLGNYDEITALDEIYQYALSEAFPHLKKKDYNTSFQRDCHIYLSILRIISDYQKNSEDRTWQSKYPINFLSEAEEKKLRDLTEYRRFKKAYRDDYIYEIMKLSQEVEGFNTLDHVCGVTYIAMDMARSLKSAGFPVDLGCILGAALGHDIGKYGCTEEEFRRVPYLHYYYTDQWFKKHGINTMGHIAVNHSTWDLELENLPLESLILIYSDFRVKNRTEENGTPYMHIYSLDESFQVILDKLDNVDAAKLKRYKRVYAKLKDFDKYVGYIYEDGKTKCSANTYALLQGNEVVDNVKYISINHNVRLMSMLRDEASLNAMLESARSEKDWQDLREYLYVLEEYSTYFTQRQKQITISFLYEGLTHKEDDIRHRCAKMIGNLIAIFDEDYRKEVPKNVRLDKPEITSTELLDKYIELFLNPDHKIIPMHKNWIGYSLSIMIDSLLSSSSPFQAKEYLKIIIKYFDIENDSPKELILLLLEASRYLWRHKDENILMPVERFVLSMLESEITSIRILALSVSYKIAAINNGSNEFILQLRNILNKNAKNPKPPVQNYLARKLAGCCNIDLGNAEKGEVSNKKLADEITEVYLKNLKTATDWVIKREQVDLILEYAIYGKEDIKIHAAMHFCNLLKVSEVESVRNRAGEALVLLTQYLASDQINDVAIELLRALEIDGYQFAEYIPPYLGQVIIHLSPFELDEILDDLVNKIKNANPSLKVLLLKTLGVFIHNYPRYRRFHDEDQYHYNKRLEKMLGIILNGLADYSDKVIQAAFSVLGRSIFGSVKLDLEFKYHIFGLVAKKMLTLLENIRHKELLFFAISAGLNHIYRFLADYELNKGYLELQYSRKIAFFPGTFDPFSMGHKEIAKAIRDIGFEVYLAVDEFSWSKKTHPHLLRKNIINMSIADELHIYLYPEIFPTNLSNNDDLKRLRENFHSSQVFIVVGSDVIRNASAYKAPFAENSIHTFPHIVFERKNALSNKENYIAQDDYKDIIKEEILRLSLEPQYEDISSTQIRDYVDKNRDISSLIDPLAQKYIYENGFYQKEPQYKTIMGAVSVNIEVKREFDSRLCEEIWDFLRQNNFITENTASFFNGDNKRAAIVRDLRDSEKIIALALFHRVNSIDLYGEFNDTNISQYIRENSLGRILMLDGIFAKDTSRFWSLKQIVLTEALANGLSRDYGCALFYDSMEQHDLDDIYELLELQGFVKLPYEKAGKPIYMVNMNSVCTLNLDVERTIKEPFLSNPVVKNTIKRCRKRLQRALSGLYPGQLLMSFDRDILNEALIKKICEENNVPPIPREPRVLGEAMCVPFGDMLHRKIVPNTVTKTLHTEKMFAPDIKNYKIRQFPYYLDLEIQVRMLKSFGRPVILVDDLLNKGYRIKAIDPIFKREELHTRKMIVGILSARGKELMDVQNRAVDSAYFIPNLKLWFNENLLYPFIGGNAVWRGFTPRRNLIPSVNLILPYMSPAFIKGTSRGSVYNLSKVCIENALDIMISIEREYEKIFERKLTLASMGHVFVTPRCPDPGDNMHYDLRISPSIYIRNDLEELKRLTNSLI